MKIIGNLLWWLFGGLVKIKAPESVRDEYNTMIKEAAARIEADEN